MELSKELILEILDNECRLPHNISLEEITPELIEKLGSTDSDSREGVLEILYSWIMDGKYDNQSLIEMGNHFCELIQMEVGKTEGDSVFLRAFTALELGGILKFDNLCHIGEIEGRSAFLSREIFEHWLKKAKNYYSMENDFRSLVPKKGWAHSVAHGADLFRDFAKHHLITKNDINEILTLLITKVFSPNSRLFTGKEEYRVATAVYTCLLQNLLPIKELKILLRNLTKNLEKKGWISVVNDPNALNGFLNGEHFCFALYFMVKFGISRKGSRSVAFYNRMIPYKDDLLILLEELISMLDNGSFYQQISPNN